MALLAWAVLLGLLVACGGEGATPTPTATVSPPATLSATATPRPTSTTPPTAAPVSTPAATPVLTPPPTAAPTPTSTPRPSPVPPSTPTPPPEAADLKLEVTSPPEDTVVTSDSVTVAGLTSPDATVSVNGILVTPDVQGRFSIDLPMSNEDNPFSIEIIATSLAGERRSVVRTVIFIP